MGEYTDALVKGNLMTAAETSSAVKNTSRFTGLSEAYLRETNLRVSRERFRKELLRDENRTVGRLDSRYKGIDKEAAGDNQETDPAMDAWMGPFTIMANKYFRQELRFVTDDVYNVFGDVMPWKGIAQLMGQPSGSPFGRSAPGVGTCSGRPWPRIPISGSWFLRDITTPPAITSKRSIRSPTSIRGENSRTG